MTILPPIDLDPVILAARVARALSLTHRFTFAQLAPDLTVIQHSPNFAAITAAQKSNQKGSVITDLLWEFVGSEEALFAILDGSLDKFRLEYINRIQGDGKINYLDFQVTPLDDQQPERGLLLLVEDVTDDGRLKQTIIQERNDLLLLKHQLARANDELKQLNELKSLFLSMAVHDLRAPLSVIAGDVGLIRYLIEQDNKEKTLHLLDVIHFQTLRANRLISDMLDLDAIDRGALELYLEPADLVEIVMEVVDSLIVSYSNRKIELTKKLPAKPLLMNLDRDKISRVIYNLVGNAYKYTQPGGEVHISLKQNDDQVIFSVIDNGFGMSEAQVGRLFQLYYRTKEAKESLMRGTGLGLYIVKMIVEAHQGDVSVVSEPNQGSTFTVQLPLLPDHDE